MKASVFMTRGSIRIVAKNVRVWRIFRTNTGGLRGRASRAATTVACRNLVYPTKRDSAGPAALDCACANRLRSGGIARLAEGARLGQSRDTAVIVTERLAQHFPGVFAEQRCRHRIDRRRQTHMQRRLDVGYRARGRMRDLAEAIAAAHFR